MHENVPFYSEINSSLRLDDIHIRISKRLASHIHCDLLLWLSEARDPPFEESVFFVVSNVVLLCQFLRYPLTVLMFQVF